MQFVETVLLGSEEGGGGKKKEEKDECLRNKLKI